MAGTVSVRELRQNLSKYLEKVQKGETLQVLSRGRAVAVLGPLPPADDVIARLLAEGKIARLPTGDLLDVKPRKPKKGERPLSELLDEMREDRF